MQKKMHAKQDTHNQSLYPLVLITDVRLSPKNMAHIAFPPFCNGRMAPFFKSRDPLSTYFEVWGKDSL